MNLASSPTAPSALAAITTVITHRKRKQGWKRVWGRVWERQGEGRCELWYLWYRQEGHHLVLGEFFSGGWPYVFISA